MSCSDSPSCSSEFLVDLTVSRTSLSLFLIAMFRSSVSRIENFESFYLLFI